MTPGDRRAAVSVLAYIVGVVGATFALYAVFWALLALGRILFT